MSLVFAFWVGLSSAWLQVRRVDGAATSGVYTDCSAVLDKPTGIIHTPNFPKPFPSPISCQWLIKAPPHKKTILYFTQFYVRLSFHVAEFDYYENDRNYSGLNELGAISFTDILTSIVAYKPYVVITFMTPADISNIHLRVDEYLLDVHGFNITYEVVDRDQSVREHMCSVHDCSFLGNCLANADFSNYTCHCFKGYFGGQCQYGPYCDPKRNINMCKNGGECRYLYGSLVNTCECPQEFEGPQCQFPKAHISSECLVLGCSQTCVKESEDRYACGCEDGYRLGMDNTTCVEEGRLRVVVGVLIHSKNNSQTAIPREEVNSQDFLTSLKTKVSEACDHWGSGVCDISRLDVSSFRNTTGGYLLEFYFYCEKSDIQKVENGIRILVSGGSISPFAINQQYLEIRTEPALHLLDVQNYDKRPAIQGQLLTLVCTARGSEFLNFRWFKDGALVRTDLANRNAWEQRVPATVHETQLDILNIENVTPLDKGVFTCEVRDYNQVENKSIGVEVIEPPSVEVNTLSATVIYNSPLSLNCLSPEDTRGLFKYAWFRAQKPLDPGENEEVVEDLVPTGARLTMKAVRISSNYSCVVTNQAGDSSLTIVVYVVSRNDSERMCKEEFLGGTRWVSTAPDGFDEHRCPQKSRGFTKRYCQCYGEATKPCSWSKVNQAGCQSEEFLDISNQSEGVSWSILTLIEIVTQHTGSKKCCRARYVQAICGALQHILFQLDSFLLGYQHSTSFELFDFLLEFINRTEGTVFMGDLNGAIKSLYQLLEHNYKFKSKGNELENFTIPLKRALWLLDKIMTLSHSATVEESRELQILYWFIHIIKLLLVQDRRTLGIASGESLHTAGIAFTHMIQGYHTPSEAKGTMGQDLGEDVSTIPSGHPNLLHHQTQANVSVYVIKVHTGLLDVPTDMSGSETYSVISDIFLALPEKARKMIAIRSSSSAVKLPVTVEHRMPINMDQRRNITRCIEWQTTKTFPYEGAWTLNSCIALSQDSWKTTCLCPYSALVAVAMSDKVIVDPDSAGGTITRMLLILACALALCCLVFTLTIHLLFYQNLNGDIYAVNTNFVISIIVANSILLFCVYNPHTQVLCVAGRLLLYFFYLAAFSFLFMEALHQFLVLHRNIPRIGFAFRYFVLGWGIPSIFIIVLVYLYVSDYRNNAYRCKYVCWISYSQESSVQQFVAMIVPVSILILISAVLSCLSLRSVMKWTDQARQPDKRQIKHRVWHSSFILVLLLLIGIFKAVIEISEYYVHFYVFLFLNPLLGFSILILRCFCDIQVRKRIFCSKHPILDKSSTQSSVPLVSINSSTYSGYLRPQATCASPSRSGILASCGSPGVVSSVNSDYSRRKEHLLSLLGTSNAYDGVPLGDPPYNNVVNAAGQNQRDTFLDSGIYEGSDPEKASSASSSLKEKGTLAQSDKGPLNLTEKKALCLCDREVNRRSPRRAVMAGTTVQENFHSYRYRLSKCSSNSSVSSDAARSIGTNGQTRRSSGSAEDSPKYECTYSEIIGTVSGPLDSSNDGDQQETRRSSEHCTLLSDKDCEQC